MSVLDVYVMHTHSHSHTHSQPTLYALNLYYVTIAITMTNHLVKGHPDKDIYLPACLVFQSPAECTGLLNTQIHTHIRENAYAHIYSHTHHTVSCSVP